MKRAAFTIVARNYVPLALNLAASVAEHDEGTDFIVFVTDAGDGGALPAGASAAGPAPRLVAARDLDIADFRKKAFYYDIVEFSTAIKPACVSRLFDEGYGMVAYLDPDMMCYGDLSEIWAGLEDSTALLVPHVLLDRPGALLEESAYLNNGTYNLGLFAVKDNDEARRLLSWWGRHLEAECFLDYDRGLATDQKWANLMPALFAGVATLRDPGYDVAFWNIHERPLSVATGRFLVRGSSPLKVFHFSGYDFRDLDRLTRGMDLRVDLSEGLGLLYRDYRRRLLALGIEESIEAEYGFSRFDNGYPVLPLHRKIFFELRDSPAFGDDPFAVAGKGSFFAFLRAKRLTRKRAAIRAADPRVPGGRTVSGLKGKIALAAFGAAVRILGLDRTLSLTSIAGWMGKTRNIAALYARNR